MGAGGEVQSPSAGSRLLPASCKVSWTLLLSQSTNHEADHGDVDDGLAGGRQVFVVLAETTMAPKPAESALNDPTSREELEAFDVVGSFDNLHLEPVALAQATDPVQELASISAVCPDEPQSHKGVLDQGQDKLGTVAVLNAGRMDDGDQHEPEDIYDQMALASIDLLARIVAMRAPLSVVLTD